MRTLLPLALFACAIAHAAEPAAPAPAKEPAKEAKEAAKAPEPVSREAKVTIDGKLVPYKVTAAKLMLKNDEGKERAGIFHVSYERTDVADPSKRPVLFAFNGGPGSSAVWLHVGVLGPKRIDLPGDGTQPPVPPARLIDNPQSILDACDIVFVDPVATGYSHTVGDAKKDEFTGLENDISSLSEFIRRWVSEHKRWGSPKFLLGESYGGIRVVGLAQSLQQKEGMSFNGVVMLSSLLDFRTLSSSPGDDLSDQIYLPSFTATAHYHGKLTGDASALMAESKRFAANEYAQALQAGNRLTDDQRKAIAEKLATLSGIPADLWLRYQLRLSSSVFRSELLRKEGKIIGRFDGRVAWPSNNPSSSGGDDPSLSLAYGTFSTALLDYLGRDLGWQDDRQYEILSSKLGGWKWNSENRYVNMSDELEDAMLTNPHLKIMVMCGDTDLATPGAGIEYSVNHLLGLQAEGQKRIHFSYFHGGHMFYLNPTELPKTRSELVKFIESAVH